MKSIVLSALLGTLLVFSASAQVTFTLASPAVAGPQEVGFDSQLVSAGRADPAYNGAVSLPFTWSGLPAGTKALAVIYDDPDARLVMKAFGVAGDVWTHWVATDLDPAWGGLKADAARTMKLVLGKNTWGNAAYGGPAPPSDVPGGVPRPIVHVYRLRVFALSAPTGLPAGFSVDDLTKAMKGKLLGTGELRLSWSN